MSRTDPAANALVCGESKAAADANPDADVVPLPRRLPVPEVGADEGFNRFVAAGRRAAEAKGLPWDLSIAADGKVDRQFAWDVGAACGAVPPPEFHLTNLGSDPVTLDILNIRAKARGLPTQRIAALPDAWQSLVKAAIAWEAFIKRNMPVHAMNQVARPLRVLATCVGAESCVEPWQLTVDDVRKALEVADEAQDCGGLGDWILGLVSTIFDARHVSCNGPLRHALTRPARERRSVPVMLTRLEDRAEAHKLPEHRPFFELARILICETPRTFVDHLRFGQLKTQLLTGSRVGEVVTVPSNWKIERVHLDHDGKPCGESGGISRSIVMRYFALKSQEQDSSSTELVEAFQQIPAQFEDEIERTLDGIRAQTEPLRSRLKLQVETGRPLPELAPDDLIGLDDAYTRLTGNPLVRHPMPPTEMLQAYWDHLDLPSLSAIVGQQQQAAQSEHLRTNTFYTFWYRRRNDNRVPPLRDRDGSAWPLDKRAPCLDSRFVRVGELEDYIRKCLRTKMSDTTPFRLVGGKELAAHDLLFLMPKRALAEGLGVAPCDVTRHFSVGRVTTADVIRMLHDTKNGIFARYGADEEARGFTLETHSLRHEMTTELLANGLSDAILTKLQNRQSKTQIHIYKHPKLIQSLTAVSLPKAARSLPPAAKTLAKVIFSGKGRGRIIDEFRLIEAKHGADRAFEFLAAEADGFHVTPYGACVNGFTQDPCPKHLGCFDCSQMVATDLDSNKANLSRLAARTKLAVEEARKRQPSPGRDNQIAHGEKIIGNIGKVLAAKDGDRPFIGGEDRSVPLTPQTASDHD